MKKKHNELIIRANEILLDKNNVVNIVQSYPGKDESGKERTFEGINESYNGQTAALGVTIAMSGLLPALAIYYKETSNKDSNCDKKKILNAVAMMIKDPKTGEYMFAEKDQPCKALFEFAINSTDEDMLAWLQREVIDCSIALKHVIRTFKQKKNNDEK